MNNLTPSQWFWFGIIVVAFLAWLDILFVAYLNRYIRRMKWKWFCYRRKLHKIRNHNARKS